MAMISWRRMDMVPNKEKFNINISVFVARRNDFEASSNDITEHKFPDALHV